VTKPVDLDAVEQETGEVFATCDAVDYDTAQVLCNRIFSLSAELRASRKVVGYPGLIWEQVPSNGWWRVYAATRRDEFGTPEDDEGNCRMGAGPTRMDALTALAELEAPK